MNDVHNVNDEQNYLHSRFWRDNPGLRRVNYRFAEWADRAFDYGKPEVREHHLKLIRELADRYDFDGMELDWMRFGFHFQPGREAEGAAALTEFTAEVRRTLTHYEKRRGHKIQLSARVPSRPDTALGLGMDAITWARRGLVDLLVITPFLYVEPDMPVELWKSLLTGTKVKVAAGLEVTMRPYPAFGSDQTNSLETVRGAAAALLDRGADRIYLFNYMDSQTAMDDLSNYPTVLRQAGQPGTLAGKPRRHILTCSDIWAPGEPRAIPLPAQMAPGRWIGFRISTGPKPVSGSAQVRLGVDALRQDEIASWEVRANGEKCAFAGLVDTTKPRPKELLVGFNVPLAAMNRGHNVIEVLSQKAAKIVWVEIFLT